MASEEGVIRLRSLLSKDAKVTDSVVDYMLNVLKMEGTADFASYFTEADYITGVVTEILDKTPAKGDALQRSRLRTAWELCRAELKQAITKKSTGDSESNWDTPLDPEVQKTQEQQFSKLYNLRFEPHACPSDALFARLYREFRRKSMSLVELSRVRSSSQQHCVMSPTHRRLASGISLTLDGEPELPDAAFSTPLQMLWALQVLTHGWIMTGTSVKQSLAKPGTTVVDASASDCFAYLHFVQEQVMRHPGPPAATTAWALERDRQTRAKARALFAEDWPWGEALRESRERHLAVLWTCGNASLKAEPVPVLDTAMAPPPAAQPQQPSRSATGSGGATSAAQCCPRFNSAAGCTARQKFCPLKLQHRCSAMLPGGKLCNAWQHGQHRCSGQPSSPPSGGGKGTKRKQP
jgi:hypothetical protein